MNILGQANQTTAAPLPDSEAAPAKINLALHVTGKRADNYHLIETLAAFADFGDTVTLADGESPLVIDGPFAGELAGAPGSGNLAFRAATAVARAADRIDDVSLRLTKRIPVAAGLGGGSADAAATLRLLQRAWRPPISETRITEIAAQLGADVPMCLVSRPLVARGIGEAITLLAGMPALPLALVHPGVAVSTAAVFAARSGAFGTPLPAPPGRFADPSDVAQWLKGTRNDLAESAGKLEPAVAQAVAALAADDTCLFARMSGSGATAFGIFPTFAAAKRATTRIGKAQPGWWTQATMTGAS